MLNAVALVMPKMILAGACAHTCSELSPALATNTKNSTRILRIMRASLFGPAGLAGRRHYTGPLREGSRFRVSARRCGAGTTRVTIFGRDDGGGCHDDQAGDASGHGRGRLTDGDRNGRGPCGCDGADTGRFRGAARRLR